jgi:hypothetical protein
MYLMNILKYIPRFVTEEYTVTPSPHAPAICPYIPRLSYHTVEVVLRHLYRHCYKSSPLWFFTGEDLSL